MMIQSVWKNLTGPAESQVLIPAEHLWWDFKRRPLSQKLITVMLE